MTYRPWSQMFGKCGLSLSLVPHLLPFLHSSSLGLHKALFFVCGATQGIKIPSLSSWSSSPFASYHIVLVPFLCFPFQISLSKVSFAAFRPFPFPPLPLPLPSRPIPYPRGQSRLKSQPMFADLILILVFSLQIGAPESQLVLVKKCCWNDMCNFAWTEAS